MKHWSRYDRQSRLLNRCRNFLKSLNGHSDRLCREREGAAQRRGREALQPGPVEGVYIAGQRRTEADLDRGANRTFDLLDLDHRGAAITLGA
jgi:hypothetical protein